jgi:hypothetical protein
MLLEIFTLVHVVISLVAIASGFGVLAGFLTSSRFEGWTTLFLVTTVATSLTGFMFPVHHFMPSHAVGLLSLIVLGIAIAARRTLRQPIAWRKTYVVSAMIALYFNVFVLVVQLFEKVPALKALAPTQSEPPFQITQGVVLAAFFVLTVVAAIKTRGGTAMPPLVSRAAR